MPVETIKKQSLKDNANPTATVKGFFVVSNDKGMHTRPCTELVKCASNFKSEIRLSHQKRRVDAKSLLGILALAARKGAKIHVEATGIDAEIAVKSVLDLAQHKFYIQY
jgi:phosphocarrier protein HPr